MGAAGGERAEDLDQFRQDKALALLLGNHLVADRTSCHGAEANQFRLFLHAGAYWLLRW